MTPRFGGLLLLYLALLLGLAVPLGRYLARVFAGANRWTRAALGPVEALLYRAADVDPTAEHDWRQYAFALLAFTGITHAVSYAVLRTQQWHPLNPTHLPNVPPWLAFNTVVGFETGTGWESFGGEVTLSAFSQIVALVSQNFFAPAAAIGVALALARGLARRECATVGNAWVDLVRVHLYVLVPLALLFALVLVSQGVVETWDGPAHWRTLDGAAQTLLRGPVAALESIKTLGSNGEGYFNANSAHPWANPTPLANLAVLVAILLLPAALCFTLGEVVGHRRHGATLFAAMALLVAVGAASVAHFEQRGNPALTRAGADQLASAHQPGGNLEGKELRFGVAATALFATATTASSCGAVNAMHDSFTPLGALAPLLNLQLGGVVFGGAGCGLYGLLVFVLLTVFLAGLMTGRTPEYLGKKIDGRAVKLAMLVVLVPAFAILVFTAVAVSTDAGRAGVFNHAAIGPPGTTWLPHPHGFSELLYAYSSAAANNGSTFAGVTFYSPERPVFYSLTLALVMYAGRFPLMIAVLALAGHLAGKKRVEEGPSHLPVAGPLFAMLLVAVIVLVGALTFFPALSLGPVIEQLTTR